MTEIPPTPSFSIATPRHLPFLSENILSDFIPGFVVFLVAVPLCLGIALASGAPPIAGIISGILGGIVIGSLSGSHVSVSGPAAGLTVVCATAIKDIGSFEGFLTAVFLAGIIQASFGFLRLGAIAEYCPNSVIKGMLAGIGAVIILKQIPHALGRDTDFQGDFSFQEISGENTMSAVFTAFSSFNLTAAAIGLFSLFVLFLWDHPRIKKYKFFKMVPGSLAVVILGIILSYVIPLILPDVSFILLPEHKVDLPILNSVSDISAAMLFPDFNVVFNPVVLKTALIIALIASVESLLSIEASDKLDPYHRITSTNRELVAQGIGNSIAGICGGLPMTAVIVRSSTNVYSGAKTKLSAIYHGIMLLIAVLLFPRLMNLIPLASLAAVLIVVGIKLISPKTLKEVFRSGMDQFLPFLVTLMGIVFTDILTGVGIGLCFGLFFVLKTNHHDAISLVSKEKDFLMRLNKDVSFVNKAEVKRALRSIPDGAKLLIDGTKSMFIDRDIYDLISEFQEQAQYREIGVELKNVQLKSLSFTS